MPFKHVASIAVTGIAGLAELLQPLGSVGSTDETVAWMLRGLLGLGLMACAYLLRDAAKTMRETKAEVSRLAIIVATHNVMFEHWLDNLGLQDLENPGRRKSDQVLKQMLAQQVASQTKENG